MPWKIIAVLLIVFLAWAHQALCPPSPRVCGSSGGPPIGGPRIKLRDGRHLAYLEHGVSKEKANYKIILVHGFGSNKNEAHMARSVLNQNPLKPPSPFSYLAVYLFLLKVKYVSGVG